MPRTGFQPSTHIEGPDYPLTNNAPDSWNILLYRFGIKIFNKQWAMSIDNETYKKKKQNFELNS